MAVAYQFKMSEKGYFKAIEQVTVCATTKQTRTVDDSCMQTSIMIR